MLKFIKSLTPPCFHSRTTTTTNLDQTSNLDPAYNLRAKYTRFRILVIGRANAGKTTLLQRVCNTTEDPCIYDNDGKNLVSVHALSMISASDITY